MSNYAMSEIRNFRSCNVGVPLELEIDAVIETITEGWSLMEVCATAARGVADADREAIRELIETERLSLSQDDAEKVLVAYCREMVRELEDEEIEQRASRSWGREAI